MEYVAPFFHSSLMDKHDELLERLWVQALKAILDPQLSGQKLREKAGIETLRTRQEDLFFKFASKCAANLKRRISILLKIQGPQPGPPGMGRRKCTWKQKRIARDLKTPHSNISEEF